MEAKQLAAAIAASLDKHKAEDLRVIGIGELSVIADYFVIATGTSSTQVKSLADYVETELKEQGVEPLRQEGRVLREWQRISARPEQEVPRVRKSCILRVPASIVSPPASAPHDSTHTPLRRRIGMHQNIHGAEKSRK